ALARVGIARRGDQEIPHRDSAGAGLDDGLALRGRPAQIARVWHRAACERYLTARALRCDGGRVSPLRQRRDRTDQRIRLHRLQGALPLPPMSRAFRLLQMPLRRLVSLMFRPSPLEGEGGRGATRLGQERGLARNAPKIVDAVRALTPHPTLPLKGGGAFCGW